MTYANLPPAPPPAPGEAYGAHRGPRPDTVTNAVRLMYLQAVISLVGLVVLFTTKDDLKARLKRDNVDFSDSTLNTALAVGAVVGIVFTVLYALLAWQVGKGKNWARIVTWVFGGLGIISGLASFGQTETTANRITGVIGLILAVLIVVLLALRPSNDYFRGPRYR